MAVPTNLDPEHLRTLVRLATLLRNARRDGNQLDRRQLVAFVDIARATAAIEAAEAVLAFYEKMQA